MKLSYSVLGPHSSGKLHGNVNGSFTSVTRAFPKQMKLTAFCVVAVCYHLAAKAWVLEPGVFY